MVNNPAPQGNAKGKENRELKQNKTKPNDIPLGGLISTSRGTFRVVPQHPGTSTSHSRGCQRPGPHLKIYLPVSESIGVCVFRRCRCLAPSHDPPHLSPSEERNAGASRRPTTPSGPPATPKSSGTKSEEKKCKNETSIAIYSQTAQPIGLKF